MSTAGTTYDDALVPTSHHSADPPAAHRGRRPPVHRRTAARPEINGVACELRHADSGFASARRRGGHRRQFRRGLPGRKLGLSLRYRPGAGSPLRPHGGACGGTVGAGADLLPLPVALGGRALPQPLSVSAHGPERRLPDGRPVQPLRLLRGDARGLLRSSAAWLGPAARQGRPPLHRREPGRGAPVPDRRQPDLWDGRHAQHGRSRGPHSQHRA